MEQQWVRRGFWQRALFDAFIGIIATSAYFFISAIAGQKPVTASEFIVGALIGLVLVALVDRARATHEIRCAVLAFSQRMRARVVLRVALAEVVVAVVALDALFWFGVGSPRTIVVPFALRLVLLCAAAASTIFLAALGFAGRVHLSAAHCQTILRRIGRQWDTGRYEFERGATATEIRQESRFLDYLTSKTRVIHTNLRGYVFSPGSTALQQLCPALGTGNMAELVACANTCWKDGAPGRWITDGMGAHPVPEGEFANIFGNKLDHLFNRGAGFRLYRELPTETPAGERHASGPHFTTMAIKGAPGAGKSTLALQLSVTLAQQGHLCQYYSLEEEREGLLRTAANFGWDKKSPMYAGVKHQDYLLPQASSRPRRPRWLRGRRREDTSGVAGSPIGVVGVSSLGDRAMPVDARKRLLHEEWAKLPEVPRCVVIDSLEGFANAELSREDGGGVPRAELLALKDFFRDRCQMLVILVEDDGSGKPGYVDFVVDVVIQLGRRVETSYTILTVEVLKARNQTHALGPHQVKIRSVADFGAARGAIKKALEYQNPGVLVYPSLHYRLFRAHYQVTAGDHLLSTGLGGLDTMLPPLLGGHGVRRRSAIALMGPTGSGKSLMAMNFLLEGVRENTRTLLLSLRYDANTITSQSVPQERHRMRFSWQREPLPDGSRGPLYHQLQWDLEGVTRWWDREQDTIRRGQDGLMRLPYLFKTDPSAHPVSHNDIQRLNEVIRQAKDDDERKKAQEELSSVEAIIAQASAVAEFLGALADACPPRQQGLPMRWTPDARRALRLRFGEARAQFEDRIAGWLLADRGGAHPKRVELANADEDRDASAPPPYLHWDSRWWKEGGAGTGHVEHDASLLVVRDWRPGNITPEDFIDQLVHEIGEPDEESRYERVVFDDISQLRQRFPLLSDSRLFVPALIDLFKATGITSVFIADKEMGGDSVLDYGLAVMADHVIQTHVTYEQDGRLVTDGAYDQRVVAVEIEARPGAQQQAPHVLAVMREPSLFDSGQEEQIVALRDPKPLS